MTTTITITITITTTITIGMEAVLLPSPQSVPEHEDVHGTRLGIIISIMSALLTTVIVMCGAVNVWTETTLVRVFPDSLPGRGAAQEARLHAAQGERESFQLCIHADKKGMESVTVETEPLDKHIGAPEVRRVGYLRTGAVPVPGSPVMWPDPLLEFAPFALQPGETAALWITYDIPPDVKPGMHQGKVTVVCGKKRRYPVPVSLLVCDFALPDKPSLRSAFTLDRRSICAVYGIGDTNLDEWKPIYDALARERIAYRVWDGGPLVRVAKDGRADTAPFKEHLQYAVESAHMNAIDIGAGQNGIALFPEPPPNEIQDSLQYYLFDLGDWLDDLGWLDRAYIEVMALPERSQWQRARDAYFRVKRNDKRFKRLLVGAGDPYFERYTDLWAASLRQFDPYVDGLLRHGLSLSFKQPHPVSRVKASSSGGLPGSLNDLTQPADASDGCFFTYWLSGGIPKTSSPEWLQIDLKEPVTTDMFKIVWRRGFEADDIDVYTSLQGGPSIGANVQWRPFPPASPFDQSWAQATLKSETAFDSIYLEFRTTFAKGPVGVTEVMIGDTAKLEPQEHIEPLECWLATDPMCFPSLAVEALPVEARMAPWVCWGQQSAGFVHRGLCHWPLEWKKTAQEQPLVWDLAPPEPPKDLPKGARQSKRNDNAPPAMLERHGDDFLFYPGRTTLMPSIRSELLRDGLEDYECMAAIDKALREQGFKNADIARLCAPQLYPPAPPLEQLNAWTRMVTVGHVRMVWALDEIKKK